MAVVLEASDVAAAIGLPFASATDEAWAQLAADAANDCVNPLPVAADPLKSNQAQHGATMLAVYFYNRRPNGAVAPSYDFTPGPTDEMSAIYRALEIGGHSPPVIA